MHKNKRKRIISLILSALLTFALVPAVYADHPGPINTIQPLHLTDAELGGPTDNIWRLWKNVVTATIDGRFGVSANGQVLFTSDPYYDYTPYETEIGEWTDLCSLTRVNGGFIGTKKDGSLVFTRDFAQKHKIKAEDWTSISQFDTTRFMVGLTTKGRIVADEEGTSLLAPMLKDAEGHSFKKIVSSYYNGIYFLRDDGTVYRLTDHNKIEVSTEFTKLTDLWVYENYYHYFIFARRTNGKTVALNRTYFHSLNASKGAAGSDSDSGLHCLIVRQLLQLNKITDIRWYWDSTSILVFCENGTVYCFDCNEEASTSSQKLKNIRTAYAVDSYVVDSPMYLLIDNKGAVIPMKTGKYDAEYDVILEDPTARIKSIHWSSDYVVGLSEDGRMIRMEFVEK